MKRTAKKLTPKQEAELLAFHQEGEVFTVPTHAYGYLVDKGYIEWAPERAEDYFSGLRAMLYGLKVDLLAAAEKSAYAYAEALAKRACEIAAEIDEHDEDSVCVLTAAGLAYVAKLKGERTNA